VIWTVVALLVGLGVGATVAHLWWRGRVVAVNREASARIEAAE
jgi:hypothetical protein